MIFGHILNLSSKGLQELKYVLKILEVSLSSSLFSYLIWDMLDIGRETKA